MSAFFTVAVYKCELEHLTQRPDVATVTTCTTCLRMGVKREAVFVGTRRVRGSG